MMNSLQRRILENRHHCLPGERHCEGGYERNVFSRADEVDEFFPVETQVSTTSEPTTTIRTTTPSPSSGAVVATDPPSGTTYPPSDDTTTLTPAPTLSLPDCSEFTGEMRAEDASLQKQEITYLYQVQTTIDQTVDTLHESVLLDLERELHALLLRSWLNGIVCRSTEDPISVVSEDRLQQEEEQQTSDDKPYIISNVWTAPEDRLLPGRDGVRCRTNLVPDARRCFIVSGGFTLVGEGALEDTPALDYTEDLMNLGHLDQVHEDVRQVRFIEPFVPPSVDSTDGDGDRSNDPINVRSGADDDIRAWPWVLLSLGILTIMGCFFLFGARRRHRRRNREGGAFDDSVPPEDSMDANNNNASSLLPSADPDDDDDDFRRPYVDSSDDEGGSFPRLV